MAIDRDILRTDATVEMQAGLDSQVRDHYPLLDSPQALDKYTNGSSVYASFQVQIDPFLIRVYQVALQRASAPDDPAFCHHGNKHATFPDTIEGLIQDLQQGIITIKKQPYNFSVNTTTGSEQTRVWRLILEGQERTKLIFRPGPHQLANEVRSRYPHPEQLKPRYRVLRKAAADYGIPFSILSAIYLGLNNTQIIAMFENKNVRKEILSGREKVGVRRAIIPHKNELREFTKLYLAIIQEILMSSSTGLIPKPSADGYFNALNKFPPEYKKDFSDDLTRFIESPDRVIPRGVFAGLSEKAHLLAVKEFCDPYRSIYIDRAFGNIATTQLITAFLEVKVQPSQYRYSHLLQTTVG